MALPLIYVLFIINHTKSSEKYAYFTTMYLVHKLVGLHHLVHLVQINFVYDESAK